MERSSLKLLGRVKEHIRSRHSTSCTYEFFEAGSVSLAMAWYYDEVHCPKWMNIASRVMSSGEYFEMKVLDSNMTVIKSDQTETFRDVCLWIDEELKASSKLVI